LPQGFGSLLEFKVPQIFENDSWHRHAQRSRKILHRHGLLLFLVRQKINQARG
jgi:hypothetical protein